MKRNITVIITVIIAAIIFIAGVALYMNRDGKDNEKKSGETTATVNETDDPWDGIEIIEDTVNGQDLINQETQTDENGSVITETKNDETTIEGTTKKTKKNNKKNNNKGDEETTTEAYPGEADGWSPIVTPDEID